jgi:thiol-disulfide isomerase/thioredoxin
MHRIQYQCLTITGIIILSILAVVSVVSGQSAEISSEITNPDITSAGPAGSAMSWTGVTMTDAATGEQFSIDDIAKQGKPVVIHTFAIWCSACMMQLHETERLLAENPDRFTIIGIDIDPNENQDMVKRHIEKNKFPGTYAASPKELSRGLVDSFGSSFLLELPNTLIVCNKTITRVGSEGGLFRESTLNNALSTLCG